MKIKGLIIVGTILSVIISAGCNNGGGATTSDNMATVDSDTVALEPQMPVKVIERLPDTTYASIDRIWYNVVYRDTVGGMLLDTLDDLYADTRDIMTFRGGPYRDAAYGAILDTMPTRLEVAWRVDTELETRDTVMGPWYGGSGWTGQPLLVDWPDSLAARLKHNGVVNKNFSGREIMVGSLCGKVYFINPETGSLTRQPIDAGNPLKGTVSFDPTFNGFLYVGHGTHPNHPFGCITIDLFSNKTIHIFDRDPGALRGWGAYDSSALRVGQFVMRPAENGSIYKFLVTPDGLQLHTVLRYKVNGAAPGIESSMAVYANYGVVADNHGNVLAVNLDTMRPVWHYALGDDSDASPVITEEDGVVYVYVGCEVDRTARGYAVLAKLNLTDGSEVWRLTPESQRREVGTKHFDGGFYATPLPGTGDCENLLFANLVKNTSGANGALIAVDRTNGMPVYEVPLNTYTWSSPIGFLTRDGRQVIVTADGMGNMYIIEGKTGKIIACQSVGSNFESTPIPVGDAVVVGSRSNGIFKVLLK